MTRLSAINSYEEGGLKMPDLDSMIKAPAQARLVKTNFQCKQRNLEVLP